MRSSRQRPATRLQRVAWSVLLGAALVATAEAGKGGGGGGGGGGGKGDPPPPPDPAIVFQDARTNDIMIMNEDGTNVTLVYAGADRYVHPKFTADGQRVLFADIINGQAGLWVIGVDGQGLTLVTPLNNGSPALYSVHTTSVVSSLDGVERVAFNDYDANGQMALFVVNLDGSGRQILTGPLGGVLLNPAWSPDGKMLSARLRFSGIVVLDLAVDPTGLLVVQSEASVTELPGSPLQGMDGEWSTWAHGQPWLIVTMYSAAIPNEEMWLIDLRTPTTPLRLTNTSYAERWPSFTPDDAALVYEARNKNAQCISRVQADGSGYAVIRSNARVPDRRGY